MYIDCEEMNCVSCLGCVVYLFIFVQLYEDVQGRKEHAISEPRGELVFCRLPARPPHVSTVRQHDSLRARLQQPGGGRDLGLHQVQMWS